MRRISALLMLLAACGGDAPSPAAPVAHRPRVAIFGVDGATFDVIDPLIAQGKLPALAGLIARGARCVLHSDIAEGASPVLWASMATGARKADHGIVSFTREVTSDNPGAPMQLLTSSDRRLPALWNMVDTRGGSVGIVGWWNTWPAEHVRGYIVSDLFATSLVKRNYAGGTTDGVVWPPELLPGLQPFAFAPSALRREELAPLGEFSDAEWAALSADDSTRTFVAHDGLAALRYGLQSQKSFASAGLHLLETQPQPDLFFVFLELPDRVGHNFWHAYQPDKVYGGAEAVDPGWRQRWAHIVPGSYEIVDDWIARTLTLLGPDTTIFVVSDHGFRSSGGNGGSPADLAHVGHNSGTHTENGVLIAAGPAIRWGAGCAASIYDIVPTVLAAMGLPGTTQGIGRVLTPLLAPEFLAEHPLQPPIAEPALVHGDRALLPIDEERLNQLRATGYNLGGKDEVQGDEDSNPLGVQPESLTIRPGETATFLILGGPSAEGARPTGFTASPAIPGISFRFESIEAGRTSLRCEADSSAQQGTHAVTIGCPGGVTLGVTLIVTPGA